MELGFEFGVGVGVLGVGFWGLGSGLDCGFWGLLFGVWGLVQPDGIVERGWGKLQKQKPSLIRRNRAVH